MTLIPLTGDLMNLFMTLLFTSLVFIVCLSVLEGYRHKHLWVALLTIAIVMGVAYLMAHHY